MADVLSMSLDDIINKNKDKVGGKGRDRGGEDGKRSREDRKGSRRPAKAGSTGGGGKLSLGGLRVVVRNSGVSKAGGARNARGQGSRVAMPAREPKAPVDPEVLDGNKKWQHDLYTELNQGPPRRNLQRRMQGPADGFRLLVTNLADGVSDDDIKELFESCGKLKYAGIHWDRSGRSTGEAEVVYENKADALKAKSQFDNVALDGQAMHIEFVQSQAGERVLASGIRVGAAEDGAGSRSNVAFTRSFQRATSGALGAPRGRRAGGGGGFRSDGGGRRGGRGGGSRGSRVVSQADLDKDLDAYMEE
ncbi:g10465 [Coccomyxa elongata]